MLSKEAKSDLERQQYRIVGNHSAVKVCTWTRKLMRNEGGCYKLKFYGIRSDKCMQMTTSLSCANRCTFCWRGYKAPVSKEWAWEVDEPDLIIKESLVAQYKLLTGMNGNPKVTKAAYKESLDVKHVALSLTGEPITYPKINELVKKFHERGISTFLVTNAQYPEAIKDLQMVTQLYLSLDAPNKKLLKEIDKPLFKDYWERLVQSLDYLAKKQCRTCIRLTHIKGINDVDIEKYAELIHRGNPDFIEVKSYMFVGASRQILAMENMPLYNDVVDFSKKLVSHLPDYEIVSDHVPSRVTMIAHKKLKINGAWHTWIDFEKFNQLIRSGNEFNKMDFLQKTPQTGLNKKSLKK